jgi:hypothetical protein
MIHGLELWGSRLFVKRNVLSGLRGHGSPFEKIIKSIFADLGVKSNGSIPAGSFFFMFMIKLS